MSTVKEWPRLFTLDSKGKVRIFDCKITSGMMPNPNPMAILESVTTDGYAIITATGLLNGKLIEQQELVKQGKNKGKKNETDPLAQAMLQADSLWLGKFNEGYKSLTFLINECDKRKLAPQLYMESIPEHLRLLSIFHSLKNAAYTNSNWDELPMLAHPLNKVKKLTFPMLGQPKLNGVRCLSKVGQRLGVRFVKLMSRGGQYYTVITIQQQLEFLYEKLGLEFENVIFDGELYKHGVPLQEISGASKKDEDGLFTSNEWLEYHIYDAIDLNNINASQESREKLRLMIADIAKDSYPKIKFVNSVLIPINELISKYHNGYVAAGYEGLILRDLSSSYKFNERSSGLLKVKEFIDEEFLITGCETDENKSIEESFVFTLLNNTSSDIFKARPTGTAAQKMRFYMNINDFVGKKATIRYFERSKEGIPTMGHVRSNETSCLVEHIRPDGE